MNPHTQDLVRYWSDLAAHMPQLLIQCARNGEPTQAALEQIARDLIGLRVALANVAASSGLHPGRGVTDPIRVNVRDDGRHPPMAPKP